MTVSLTHIQIEFKRLVQTERIDLDEVCKDCGCKYGNHKVDSPCEGIARKVKELSS